MWRAIAPPRDTIVCLNLVRDTVPSRTRCQQLVIDCAQRRQVFAQLTGGARHFRRRRALGQPAPGEPTPQTSQA